MAPRPSGPHLAQRLRTLSLTSPTTTALFYARLYHALFPATDTEHDSTHVLALCLLADGQPYSALHLVRDSADADGDPRDDLADYDNPMGRRPGCYGCAVIVAKVCNKLCRFTEGQQVLERAVRRSVPMTIPTPSPVETAATASLLLATLSHKGKASAQAVEYYTRALSEDPWLWEAYVGLCDIGAPPSLEATFPDPPSVSRANSARPSRHATLSPGPMPRSSASEVPNFLSRRQMSPLASAAPGFFTPDPSAGAAPTAPSRIPMLGPQVTFETPSVMGDTTFPTIDAQSSTTGVRRGLLNSMLPAALRSTPNPVADAPPAKPPAMKRPRGAATLRKHAAETPVGVGPLAGESRLNGRDLRLMVEANGDKEAPPRRSSRLNTTTTNKAASSRLTVTRDKRATRSQSVTSSASGHTGDANSAAAAEAQVQAQVDDWLRDIVRRCARAYRYLSQFQCQKAMDEMDSMPVEIQTSPWTYDLISRCFYEMGQHVKARRAFKLLRQNEPYRLENMEMFSTTLWHLNDALELSNLSQDMLAIDREAPSAWMVAGNCFSLQGAHDEAMRCFRRAAQLDPGCAYAWTLCGHEATAMEEFDRAIAFFRTAIRSDARHFNAWYGMGVAYMKMGKNRHAEHHYRRAAEINPSNPALLCCIGTVMEKMNNYPGALAVYEQACQSDDKESAMARFNRTRVLVALGRIPEAISVLEQINLQTPGEANVHFLLGKCYLRMGRNTEAIGAFTSARELQPKLENAIRATMLARGEEDIEEPEE